MHWNVAPDALPVSAKLVRILDYWRNEWLFKRSEITPVDVTLHVYKNIAQSTPGYPDSVSTCTYDASIFPTEQIRWRSSRSCARPHRSRSAWVLKYWKRFYGFIVSCYFASTYKIITFKCCPELQWSFFFKRADTKQKKLSGNRPITHYCIPTMQAGSLHTNIGRWCKSQWV